MSFRVDLEIFRGPLDLLLYLVRKHEVEIVDLPIALVTEQFLAYLSLLKELDVNAVGDFVEMASTLMEIKSRLVLPHHGDEAEEDLDDPRQELVQRLLEYKGFQRCRQYSRRANSGHGRRRFPAIIERCSRAPSGVWPTSRFMRSSFGIWSAPSVV